MKRQRKSKVVAALLAWFLGTFGAHRYYLGYKKRGVFMTVVSAMSVVLLPILNALLIDIYRRPYVSLALNIIMLVISVLFLVVAIMALVDFIKILIDKLMPADGSRWAKKSQLNTDASIAERQISQYIIDSAEAASVIREYNEMLLDNVITREDYDAKKKQLLGL